MGQSDTGTCGKTVVAQTKPFNLASTQTTAVITLNVFIHHQVNRDLNMDEVQMHLFYIYQNDTASAKENLITWLENLED